MIIFAWMAGGVDAQVKQDDALSLSASKTEQRSDSASPKHERKVDEFSFGHLDSIQELIKNHCVDCHDGSASNQGLNLRHLSLPPNDSTLRVWEKVVRKLTTGQMPPSEAEQPPKDLLERGTKQLIETLDKLSHQNPNVGRTATFRRLTRYEYQNAIRDLLGIKIDAKSFLPADEMSHGFDNVTVGELPPALLQRYVSAAQRISRLAIGSKASGIEGFTIRPRPDLTQEEHVEGLPLGTRGGVLVSRYFSRPGHYRFVIRLTRDRNEHVEGLKRPHNLDLLLDGSLIDSFRVYPPKGNSTSTDDYTKPSHENVDRHLTKTLFIEPGTHEVGATFIKNPTTLLESKRQPLDVAYNMYRHPRRSPAIYEISITGPFQEDGVTERIDLPSSPSNPALTPWPKREEEQEACAKAILGSLAEKALRRTMSSHELDKILTRYRSVASDRGFNAGIEFAISYLLIHPEFLFRIERDSKSKSPEPYRLSDFEIASRLSFFLWSSVPDETLLKLANDGKLHQPDVLCQQMDRMIDVSKFSAFVENFAGQWLYLRNLESFVPDARAYPNFDDNLRQAFKRETEEFVGSVIRERLPVQTLIDANFTFLNERLAKHYDIPGIFGSQFRKIQLPTDSQRGGLLRHGSILSVSSYANRTSPVLRGKWVLENLLGTPPPPPPENVPDLDEAQISQNLSVRERLRIHRESESCASCHRLIDPIGFAMQHFDAIGRWRDLEGELVIDSTGGLPDGSELSGIDDLEDHLSQRPNLLAYCIAEKLVTYALGRGVEPSDARYIREIVSRAAEQNYKFSAIIESLVLSPIFQMRMSKS